MTGPYGSFTIDYDSASPVVFITSGIGVTPARSMIAQATFEKLPNKIYLFSANRSIEHIPFLNEFSELRYRNPYFVPVFTITGEYTTQWKGEKGRIDMGMLKRHVKENG